MIKKRITITNKYGLHARACAKLVNMARRFQSKIELLREKTSADCKSIMALMTLGAKKGTIFNLVITGQDEEEAMTAIVGLIRNKFGEE